MRTIWILILLAGPVAAQCPGFTVYEKAFVGYATNLNPDIPSAAASELAKKNWDVTDGNFQMARRLAGMENVESGHFKLAAWVPDAQPPSLLYPRYDALGSHINLIAQEARRLGLIPKGVKDPYEDRMEALLNDLAADPAYGTWIVAHAYVRQARKIGMDRACHLWQTGQSWFPSRESYKNDPYLKNIRSSESYFSIFVTGAPLTVAPKKRRRTR